MRESSTIYALSSGRPPAAIAVIRVSGAAAGTVLQAMAGTLPAPRRASRRSLRDPVDGTLLDDALILWFPGPGTATGEDLAEFHVHGGRAVVAAVSRAIAGMAGVREAHPGEFTRRAFLNRRIDLAEAEGLRDLLAAETEAHRRAAMAAASGALGRRVEAWRVRLLDASAQIEAMLDFADEDDVDVDLAAVRARIMALATDLGAALGAPPVERLRDGIRVVIAGPPNAGKSTLLNALVERDAAIVAATPGTTRDVLEIPVAIDGVPMLLSDTAGLRGAMEPVEAEGIARAEAAIAGADLVLWLGKCPPPMTARRTIMVHARADLNDGQALDVDAATIRLSVLQGWGVDRLVAGMLEEARRSMPAGDEALFNQRQRLLLVDAHDALLRCNATRAVLFLGEELRLARAALDAITGRAGVEDMLDALFSGFCIGK